MHFYVRLSSQLNTDNRLCYYITAKGETLQTSIVPRNIKHQAVKHMLSDMS